MYKTILLLITGWYVCSIGLMLYNKWIFDPQRGLGIAYPIGLTGCHQLILWCISSVYLRYTKARKERRARELDSEENAIIANNNEPIVDVETLEREKRQLFWRFILPTAIFSAGDIGLGNMSLRYVPLTIHIIIKSSSITFVLLFSCLFKIERFHWRLFVIVFVMFAGVVMMVYKPINDDSNTNKDGSETSSASFYFGCVLVLLSSCLSGLRWVYTQLILRNQTNTREDEKLDDNVSDYIENKSTDSSSERCEVNVPGQSVIQESITKKPATPENKNNPIRTINKLSPVMALFLFLTSLAVEQPYRHLFSTNFSVKHVFLAIFGLMVLPGLGVFTFTLCEFSILGKTKVLTLSIAGVVKEVLTIIFSMLILHERLHGILNWVGMVIILLDVTYYNYFRYKQKMQEDYVRLEAPAAGFEDKYMGNRRPLETDSMTEIPPYSITSDNTFQEYEMNKIIK
ncbi:uncharacterized protein HLK63_E03971 [Nakaseomyces glabratus]|nr:uncharacterized protein GW608_E03971 [Nakaseomyces glabratus]UCS25083.1 uncharacterized protein HLK63_E03971 [Nakaseomyces glabratus]UCS30313.1 uncharacterized protein HLK64_E03971 [Nakaseomyces glabratus]UCS35542.1 uncharacterized protein HLK62_E03971 [Nakaseomyces glabratus]